MTLRPLLTLALVATLCVPAAPLSAKDTAIDNWDELSRGSDPTDQ